MTDQAAYDLAVQHRVHLGRYSTGVVRKVLAALNRLDADIVARLAAAGDETGTGARLTVLLSGIRQMQDAAWRTIQLRLDGDLTDLAGSEAEFAQGLTRAAAAGDASVTFSPVPSLTQVLAAVNARPFQGKLLRDWLSGTEANISARVRDAIRQGFVEGRPTSDIVKIIRGTRAMQYRDGLMEISRRSAETMVRTAITHTANVAHEAVYQANADVVKAVEWVSVLDSRTTLLCASRDGMIMPVGSGPRPPAHYGCRSTMAPVVGDIVGVEKFERKTYPEWLKGQSVEVQNEVLGPTRGKLFRQGGVTINQFVDRKGATLTLEQLRRADASAFERAGVSSAA